MLAIDILEPCFTFIKRRFFPINKTYWLKLGLVSLISTRGSGNYQIGRAIDSFPKFGEFMKRYWILILSIGGIGVTLGLLWNIIQNTFMFIFLESVISGKVKIKDSFKKHVKKGVSLFYFQLLIGLSVLLSISIIVLPGIIVYFSGNTPSIVVIIPYIIVGVILLFLAIMLAWIINLIVYNLVIYEMYTKNIRFKTAFSKTIELCKKQWTEVLMFLLFRILISIGAGVTIVFLLIPIGMIFLIIVGIFAFPLILIGNLIIGLIIGIPLAIILLSLFIYTLAVVSAPVSGYLQYYSYRFMKDLQTKKKV